MYFLEIVLIFNCFLWMNIVVFFKQNNLTLVRKQYIFAVKKGNYLLDNPKQQIDTGFRPLFHISIWGSVPTRF